MAIERNIPCPSTTEKPTAKRNNIMQLDKANCHAINNDQNLVCILYSDSADNIGSHFSYLFALLLASKTLRKKFLLVVKLLFQMTRNYSISDIFLKTHNSLLLVSSLDMLKLNFPIQCRDFNSCNDLPYLQPTGISTGTNSTHWG